MSLDVHLITEGVKSDPAPSAGSGIFIREDGQTREISHEEWIQKFPGRVPVIFQQGDENRGVIYHANITHNLGKMAESADLYAPLWTPDKAGFKKAGDLIGPLAKGLEELKRRPEFYMKFNPPNGWGTYSGFVDFVEKYLEACKRFPEAKVGVSR